MYTLPIPFLNPLLRKKLDCFAIMLANEMVDTNQIERIFTISGSVNEGVVTFSFPETFSELEKVIVTHLLEYFTLDIMYQLRKDNFCKLDFSLYYILETNFFGIKNHKLGNLNYYNAK